MRRLLAVLAVAVLPILAPAAQAAAGASSADSANIHAYLLAEYEYDRALAASGSASAASEGLFAGSVASACPGVLAGVPNTFKTMPLLSAAPRVRGRWDRGRQRLDAILGELQTAELEAFKRPLAGAIEALVAAESALHWNDPALAGLAASRVQHDRELLPAPAAPDVCGDTRAWRASGFRTLPPAAQHEYETRGEPRGSSSASLDAAIKPLESAPDRALDKAVERASGEALASWAPLFQRATHLEAILGLEEALQSEREQQRQREREPVAATGTTASGERFEVKTRPHSRSHRIGCGLEASVELVPSVGALSGRGILSFVIGGEGEGNLCLRGPLSRRPPVPVCEAGSIEVAAAVPRRTRSVRLLLSDGRKIVSSPVAIPARVGGPALVYVQAVRGPKPIPVSLTELDARGRPLRTIALRHLHDCRGRPLSSLFPTPATLAQGTAPDGRTFEIVGDDSGALGARLPFNLILLGGPHAEVERFGQPRAVSSILLQLSLAHECSPVPYTIVYGVLAPRGGEALARVGGKLVPLARVPIPARLRPHGAVALVYGIFAATPSQLVVQGRSGRPLQTISLRRQAGEENAYCTGWAEG